MRNLNETGFADEVVKSEAEGFAGNLPSLRTSTMQAASSTIAVDQRFGPPTVDNNDGPLTPAELEMLEWNRPVLQPSGRIAPPDVEYEYMLRVMAIAKKQSGRAITNLDELERIARKHNQGN
jgi:hypothetical protein